MMGRSVKNQRGLKGAWRLVGFQLGLTLLLATIALFYAGVTAVSSAVLGGLVSMLPTAYFATTLFQYQGARAARQILSAFYKGEALKIILTIILFALVFKFFTVIPVVFFGVYIMDQMIFWFAPLIFK